jgi:hypothetical protein
MTHRTLLAPAVADRLAVGLRTGDLDPLRGAAPATRRDRALTLLALHDLHTAPLDQLGERARFQHHPVVAELKTRLEGAWLVELEAAWAQVGPEADATTPDGAVQSIRGVAVLERIPAAYRWLADTADWAQLLDFLALEGGPDGGFDDLVALCQVGLTGSAKLELGKNSWDEMGQGDPDGVHTTLHDRLVAALALPRVPRSDQPVEALERAALGGLLATNRWLQPELLGALGLLELQAGPRCRMVLKAFDRLGAPEDAYPFYREHAEVDPVHGKDWVEKAIAPTVAQHPAWGPRIVKGAWWRASVNLAFFERVRHDLVEGLVAA